MQNSSILNIHRRNLMRKFRRTIQVPLFSKHEISCIVAYNPPNLILYNFQLKSELVLPTIYLNLGIKNRI